MYIYMLILFSVYIYIYANKYYNSRSMACIYVTKILLIYGEEVLF